METINETIKAWLKEQNDSDLLDLAEELNHNNDSDCEWMVHYDVEDVIHMKAEAANGDLEKIVELVEWARDLGPDCKYLDGNWDREWDEADVIASIKAYYLDELVGIIGYDMSTMGEPEEYYSVDTSELLGLLVRCPEWREQYGPEWEYEYGPNWERECFGNELTAHQSKEEDTKDATRWETNASWLHDYGYDEFRVLGVFDSKEEAVNQIVFLANECGKLVADDISIFDAVAITLDARPCGPNEFEYSIDVYPDGTSRLY